MAASSSPTLPFASFAARTGLLQFGTFQTSSGRESPYFFNSGACARGDHLAELGDYYAEAVVRNFGDATILFGPAYKGIPLALTTAVALARRWQRTVGFCFDRKERKAHGEGGILVGQLPVASDRVVIVDDVVTDGATKREAIELLRAETGVMPMGLVLAVDRQERGNGHISALHELEQEFGLKVAALATISQIVGALANVPIDGHVFVDEEVRHRIRAYLDRYGVD